MRFNNEEIVFLTSVSRGNVPFGIKYKLPREGEKEAFVERAIQSLMQKGILDEQRKLTKEGAGIIRCWEEYRNCKEHVMIHRIRAAILPGGMLVAALPDGDVYEVQYMNAELLMLAILKQARSLCGASTQPERGKWQDIEGEMMEGESGEQEGMIPIIRFEYFKATDRRIIYWKGDRVYQINPDRMRMRALSPVAARKMIYTMIGGNKRGGN